MNLSSTVSSSSTTETSLGANDPRCDIYRGWRNRSRGLIIRGYEGIPQNLVLNVIGLMILIVVFSFLRKKAWNYGRIALLDDIGWTTLFYSASKSKDANNKHNIDDSGFFNWIKITYSLTDAQFLAKSGPDALQYLSYQRHLIFIASIITVSSLVIVLPLNLQGASDKKADISVFEQATIFNLGSDSKLLWIHEILALVFLCLSIFVMRHFSRNFKFVQDDPLSRRTVLVSGISRRYCTDFRIRSHFQHAHPDCQIQELTLAYDVSKLVELEDEKIGVVIARKYWEEYILLHQDEIDPRRRPNMRPYTCGNMCCCCCCLLKTTDALAYYTHIEYKLRKQADLERKRAYAKPLGIAFITFATVAQAEKIVSEYRLTARLLMQIPVSKFSRRLAIDSWIVKMAPLKEDLHWQNLSLGHRAWYLKAVVVNVTLVLIVCFYSTPVFLLNVLNVYISFVKSNVTIQGTNVTSNAEPPGTFEGVLRDTIPTFLLWLAAVTLPSMVSLSDRFIGFWTKTSENRSKMIKTFSYLLFMVIILPSLGLTSASNFFVKQQGIQGQQEGPMWECIFSPANGSFFVNYVITSCFLGTMSELMRIPELLVYSFKICFAKSSADIVSIRRSVLWDFQLGAQYAWMMLIFAIFILFSLVTPIITIFGFCYLVLKHFVDRYNIYFAYAPCKVDKAVHATAINFVVVCTFLQQMILVAYTNINAHAGNATNATDGKNHTSPVKSINKPLQAFTILGLCLTATFFIGQVFFNMCTNFSPIQYKNTEDEEHKVDEEAPEEITSEPSSGSVRFDIEGEAPLNLMAASLSGRSSKSEYQHSQNNNHEPAQEEIQKLVSPTHSIVVESIDDSLSQIDRDSDGELHPARPGIDTPYGRYFPSILRRDYDRESTTAFNNIYHKTLHEPEDKKKYDLNYVRNESDFLVHNKLAKGSKESVVVKVPSPVVIPNSSDDSSSDDDVDAEKEEKEEKGQEEEGAEVEEDEEEEEDDDDDDEGDDEMPNFVDDYDEEAQRKRVYELYKEDDMTFYGLEDDEYYPREAISDVRVPGRTKKGFFSRARNFFRRLV